MPEAARQAIPPSHSPSQATPRWRYFLYARKSSEPDDRQVLSLPAQKQELLRAFGHLNIVEIIEEAKSAKAPGRPLFDQMLKRIEKGEADGIITWHPDRLARNSVDGGRIIYDLDQGKVKDLKFAQYTFENSPEGKWMLNIIFGQSKYFVDKLSKDVKRGQRQKIEMGWRPGVAPIGYLNNLADTKGTRTIIPDPERFPLVRQMWDLMLTGVYRPSQILRIASEEWGLRTVERKKNGSKPLSPNGLYGLFHNSFYYGTFDYNGVPYVGSHVPMITEEEFWTVQRLLGRKGLPRPKTQCHFAYTGLIRCGECGCLVTAEEKTKWIKSAGASRTYIYYHCTKKKRHLRCSQGCIEVKALEEQVCRALAPLSVGDDFLEWALQYLREIYEQEVHESKHRQDSAKNAFDAVDRHLDALLDLRVRGLIGDEEFEAKRRRLLAEKSALGSQMDNPETAAGRRLELAEQTCRFAHNLIDRFKKGTTEERKIILEKIGSNRLLHDKTFTFEPVAPYCYFAKSTELSDWRGIVEDVRTFCADAPEDFTGLEITRTLSAPDNADWRILTENNPRA